jgi:hypothetical protein
MDDVGPYDLGHHREIEVADLRKTLSETVEDTVGHLDRWKFFFW